MLYWDVKESISIFYLNLIKLKKKTPTTINSLHTFVTEDIPLHVSLHHP